MTGWAGIDPLWCSYCGRRAPMAAQGWSVCDSTDPEEIVCIDCQDARAEAAAERAQKVAA